MILPLIGLTLGICLGIGSGVVLPYGYSGYMAIGILACLDSVLGGIYAVLQKQFDWKVFITGFSCNGMFAMGLVWLGNQLSIELSIAAIVVYGSRIFNNLSKIRRFLLNKSAKPSMIETINK